MTEDITKDKPETDKADKISLDSKESVLDYLEELKLKEEECVPGFESYSLRMKNPLKKYRQ